MALKNKIVNPVVDYGKSRITRLTPTKKLIETSVAKIKKKIIGELKRESQATKLWAQQISNIEAPVSKLVRQDPRAVASIDAIRKLAEDEQLRRSQILEKPTPLGMATTFSFTANPGFQVIGPPYDLEWTYRPALPVFNMADRNTGKIAAQILSIGSHAAGVGVLLSSPVRSLVRVTPFAPFTNEWFIFTYPGPASTKGWVGVVVYGAGPHPILDYQAMLWDIAGYGYGSRGADSASSTVGRELTRDVLITMEAGVWYQVWVWCSVTAHCVLDESKAGLARGSITCEIPFMVLDAGPSLNIR